MNRAIVAAAFALSACGPDLTLNTDDLTRDAMLSRATHVFVGAIRRHHLYPQSLLRFPDRHWRALRRTVDVECVAKGIEDRKVIDIFELAWMGGATGQWNATEDGERYWFPVYAERGNYHVVLDHKRSIFPVASDDHTVCASAKRLPSR